MLILGSGCGWIPNATVNFIANIVGIIKVFVPLLIIIMGSIDFAKAIMSQKEDDIKKSQTNFIQKLIAGAAVFFVMIFISWVFRIIGNADSSLNTNDAIRCVNLMLNGGYQAEDIDTLTPPELDIGDGGNGNNGSKTTNLANNLLYDNYTNDQLMNKLSSCDTKNANIAQDCYDAKREFCTRTFFYKDGTDNADNTCFNYCYGLDFTSVNLIDAFRGSHPTGKNGCAVSGEMKTFLEEYYQNIENQKPDDQHKDTCNVDDDCNCGNDAAKLYCYQQAESKTCNVNDNCQACKYEISKKACIKELEQTSTPLATTCSQCTFNLEVLHNRFCNSNSGVSTAKKDAPNNLDDWRKQYEKIVGVNDETDKSWEEEDYIEYYWDDIFSSDSLNTADEICQYLSTGYNGTGTNGYIYICQNTFNASFEECKPKN